MTRFTTTGQTWSVTGIAKLLPLLIALALLAGVPAAVSGQQVYDVSFSESTYYVREGTNTDVSITIEVSPQAPFAFNVGFSTSDGTAEGGEDFTHVTETFEVPAGAARHSRLVELLDDRVYEPPESFSVSLTSSDARITLGTTSTDVSIEDDEFIEVALEDEMIIVQEGSAAEVCVVRVGDETVTMASTISFDMHLSFTDTGSALTTGQANPTSVGINSTDAEWCASFTTQDVDQTTDVQFELRRTPLHPRDVILQDPRFATVRVIDPPNCAANGAVTDTSNTDLITECNNLATAKEYLRGTATLNWSDTLAISSWEGVTLSGTPLQVSGLNLGGKGLNGTLATELGSLSSLRKVRLSGNSLSGSIPAEFNNLAFVDEFYLNSNQLSGEIPVLSELGSSLGSTGAIYFSLANNQLSGEIQDIAVPHERMKQLDLSNNNLTGDPATFLEGLQESIEHGPLGLTNIRLSRNSFGNNCIPLSFVEELNDRAKRGNFFGGYDPSAGLQHDFGSITCDRVPFARRPAKDFTDLGLTGPESIWSDGTTIWVSSRAGTLTPNEIRAYDLDSKARDESKDLDNLASNNGDLQAIWFDGNVLWVGDGVYSQVGSFGYIFAYEMDINADRSVGANHGNRLMSLEFDPTGGSSPRGIWSSGNTVWISQSGSGFIGDIHAYVLDINSDGTAGPNHGNRDSSKDFAGVAAEGIWSDGTTLWAANLSDSALHAYNLATKERIENMDFDLDSVPGGGIWSDGDTMWSVSGTDIFAYYMPSNTVGGIFETDTSTRAITDPDDSSPDPDPTDPDKIEVEKCVAEVASNGATNDEVGAITLGDTVSGKWEGGCPSITRGGRLAKYYTLTLPITSGANIALDSHLDTYLVLRSGGLDGTVVEQDDDDGPGNNALIERTLPAGDYTIEATTFYSDGVEAEFTLTVSSAPSVLYEGPVSTVAHRGYAPTGPKLTIKLLPTLPRGTLEITIEDADGFGAGTGPLGGPWADNASAGSVLIALSRSTWVAHDELAVQVRQSGSWTSHKSSDEQSLLSDEGTGGDFSTTLEQLPGLIDSAVDASGLIESLNTLMSSASAPESEPDSSALDAIFTDSHANCVSQVTVPWVAKASDTTGVRVSVPVQLSATDYLSVATSFVSNGEEQALAQLHDLLDTGADTPTCTQPEQSDE